MDILYITSLKDEKMKHIKIIAPIIAVSVAAVLLFKKYKKGSM